AWLAAAWGAVALAEKLSSRLGAGRAGPAEVLTVLALAAAVLLPPSAAALEAAFARRTVGAEVREVLDRALQLGAQSDGALLLGTWNLLSPALVTWHGELLSAGEAGGVQTRVAPSDGSASGLLAELRDPESRPELVLLLAASPSAPAPWRAAFAAETAWLAAVRDGLAGGELGFEALGREGFPDAGYEMTVHRRRP
ncbi:MAG: hypothetical protein R3190_09635, partial [Thermoanaerobaculia bacterium]|nr:hypothetical protein [Thermoanaerobaculia bacterium]